MPAAELAISASYRLVAFRLSMCTSIHTAMRISVGAQSTDIAMNDARMLPYAPTMHAYTSAKSAARNSPRLIHANAPGPWRSSGALGEGAT